LVSAWPPDLGELPLLLQADDRGDRDSAKSVTRLLAGIKKTANRRCGLGDRRGLFGSWFGRAPQATARLALGLHHHRLLRRRRHLRCCRLDLAETSGSRSIPAYVSTPALTVASLIRFPMLAAPPPCVGGRLGCFPLDAAQPNTSLSMSRNH
jgi:hypothetical protein